MQLNGLFILALSAGALTLPTFHDPHNSTLAKRAAGSINNFLDPGCDGKSEDQVHHGVSIGGRGSCIPFTSASPHIGIDWGHDNLKHNVVFSQLTLYWDPGCTVPNAVIQQGHSGQTGQCINLSYLTKMGYNAKSTLPGEYAPIGSVKADWAPA